MNLFKAVRLTVALLFVSVLAGTSLGGAALHAGEFFSQTDFGSTFFNNSPSCPAKKVFPTFESLVPIPAIVDPFAQDLIPVFCQIQVQNGGEGVKAVKGTYSSELVVRDNNTGDLESFPVGSGRFKTNKNGFDSFDLDIPTELFADGFESGDVSAWSYTRTDFTNKKPADDARVQCGSGSSASR